MASYGPVLAIGVIATLCVGAVLIIYRRYARGQGKSSAPKREQTEELLSEGSRCEKSPEILKEHAEVNSSQVSHTEEPREVISVPRGDPSVDPCAATADELDRLLADDCFSNPVPELQEYVKKHPINDEEYVGIHTEDRAQKHPDNGEEHANTHREEDAQKHPDNGEEYVSAHSDHHVQKHPDNDEECVSAHSDHHVQKHPDNDEECASTHSDDHVQKHPDNGEEYVSAHSDHHVQKHPDNDEERASTHSDGHVQKHSDNGEEHANNHSEDDAQKHADNDDERASTHSGDQVQKHADNNEECVSAHSDDRVQKHPDNDEPVCAHAEDPTEHHGHTGNGHKESEHVIDCQEQVSRYEDDAADHDEHPGDRGQLAREDQEYFSLHHKNLGDCQEHLSARHDYVSNPPEVKVTGVKTEQMAENQRVSMHSQPEESGKIMDTNVNKVAMSDHREHDMIDAEIGSSLGISTAGEPEQDNVSTMINVQEIPSCHKHPGNLSKDKDAEFGHDENVDDLEGNVICLMQDSDVQSELNIVEATMDDDKWLNAGCTEMSKSLPEVSLDNSGWGNAEVDSRPMVQSTGPGHAKSQSLKEPCDTHASLDEDPIKKRVVAVQPMPQPVRVSFRIHYVTHSSSQCLAVTGSLQELGGWEHFVPLTKAKDGFWVDSITLPMKKQLEWKFVLVENGKIRRWEECNNRHLEIGPDRDIHLHKWWGYL